MIEVYKYLNGHSLELKENLQNCHIFHAEIHRSLKYGLDAIPYRASQLRQQVPIDIREAASLALFKNRMKSWKCEELAKYLLKMSGIFDKGPLVTYRNISTN